MPQLAIQYGLLDEEWRLSAQSLEVASLVYFFGNTDVVPAAMAGASWFVYNRFVLGRL